MAVREKDNAPAPRFIVIGAVKAATTWTQKQLSANPALFLPAPEPHYFSTEYARGPDWYARFFLNAPDGVMIGEKSADYLAHPEAAKRIAADAPGVKLIAQLRNPIDRAYSDYCMLYRRGTVRDDPAAYFRDGTGHGERFLSGGLYARSLAAFFDRFPADDMAVFLFEDIKDRPRETIEKISRHIGVAPHIAPERFGMRENASETAILPLSMRKALKPLKRAVAPLRGGRLFEGARGLFARPVSYPPLDVDSFERLRNFYADDVKELSDMIGRDLSFWLDDARGDPASFAGKAATAA